MTSASCQTPSEQQAVAFGDRKVEVLGQVDEELATRAGPAGLDEAQVFGRDVRVQGQLELAEAASRAPEADQLARGLGLLLGLDDHPIEVRCSGRFGGEVHWGRSMTMPVQQR
jgi:hypothetical protein